MSHPLLHHFVMESFDSWKYDAAGRPVPDFDNEEIELLFEPGLREAWSGLAWVTGESENRLDVDAVSPAPPAQS
jgi:hypothetical protein